MTRLALRKNPRRYQTRGGKLFRNRTVVRGLRFGCDLRFGVESLMDLAESRVGNVRVDLRRGNGRMPEELLYGANVGPVGKKRGSEGVAEGVGRNVFYDSRLEGPLGNGGRYEIT